MFTYQHFYSEIVVLMIMVRLGLMEIVVLMIIVIVRFLDNCDCQMDAEDGVDGDMMQRKQTGQLEMLLYVVC